LTTTVFLTLYSTTTIQETMNTDVMFLDIIHRPVYISNNVSEIGFCLRLQVKLTQLGPINRASPYLRTPVPAPRYGIQAKHSTNHLRELRQNIKILKTPHVSDFLLMYHSHKLLDLV
jgi:hypothetical protein